MDRITSVCVRNKGSHFLTRYMVNTQWRYCYKTTIKQHLGISLIQRDFNHPIWLSTLFLIIPAALSGECPSQLLLNQSQLAVAHCPVTSKEGKRALDRCPALEGPNMLVGRKDRKGLSCTRYLKAPQEEAQPPTSPPRSL